MLQNLAWLLLCTLLPLSANAYPVLAVPGQPAFRLWPFNWTLPTHGQGDLHHTPRPTTITDLPTFTWSRPDGPPWLTTVTPTADHTDTSTDLPNFTWSRPDGPPWLTTQASTTISSDTSTLAPASPSPISIIPIAGTSLDSAGDATVTSIVTSIRTIFPTGTTTTSTSLTALPVSTSFSVDPELTKSPLATASTETANPVPIASPVLTTTSAVAVIPDLTGSTITRTIVLTSTATMTTHGSTITRTATATRTLTITGSPVLASTPTSTSVHSEMSIPPTTSPTLIPIPSLASTLTLSNSLVSTSSIISTSNLHSPTSAVLSIISTIIPTNPNPATTLSATSLNVPLSPTIISSSTPTTILSPATTASLSSSRTQNGFINAAYFINWGINDRNYYPNQLPAADLTHVFYAFATQLPNGTVISSEPEKDAICIRQLKVLKQNNPSLKVILSIGGWDASQDGSFSTLASTDARRYVFASSAVHMMQAYGFDGIDINWEYPANNRDGANFVLLLKEVRSALDILGNQYNRHHFLLTVAAPAEPAHYRYWRVSDMVQYLDFFNFMGYDYMGAGLSTMSGHQANLYKSSKIPSSTAFETESGVDFYIASGVPPFKIVLGMPLYGRSFENTELGGSFTAPITGSWPDSSGGTNGGGAGVWDYKVLPKAGATEIYAIDAGATYSYDADTRELISYDTVDQVRRKIDYVLSMGLAGAYFWEASADRTGEGSLILTSATRFREAGSLDSTANIVL